MRTIAPALATLVSGLVVLGCGSGGGGGKASSSSASTAAPTTSAAALAFRSLDRGDSSGVGATASQAITERVAATDAEWTALWIAHTGAASVPRVRPAVDLSTERVVGVFQGQRPGGGFGVEVVSVAAVGSAIEVAFVTTHPAGAAAGAPTQPYHLVAVNRVQGAVTFKDVTPAPVTTPVTDVHGELVTAPTRAGTSTLAFLPDGATAAQEVTDPTALLLDILRKCL